MSEYKDSDFEDSEFDFSEPIAYQPQEWKYLFYLVNSNQPEFKDLYSPKGSKLLETTAHEIYEVIEFVHLTSIKELIYDLAHRPYGSNDADAHLHKQFYSPIYFTQNEDNDGAIVARTKSLSFDITDGYLEWMSKSDIEDILTMIHYDKSVGIPEFIIHGGAGGSSQNKTSQLSLYIVGDDTVVPIPSEFVEHFKVVRVKDEREMLDIQFRLHPDPPYYVEYKDGQLLFRDIYMSFADFITLDLLEENFKFIVREKESV